MIITRELLEQREVQDLAPYALHNVASRGRAHAEEKHPFQA